MEEKLIATKVSNVLIPEAEVDLALYSPALLLGVDSVGAALHGPVTQGVLEGFKKLYGGLWVGGTVRLTSKELSFVPNALNKLAHTGDYSLVVPLADITDLAYEFGFVSGIIRITTKRGVMKMRCWGAKAFLAQISEACAEACAKVHNEGL